MTQQEILDDYTHYLEENPNVNLYSKAQYVLKLRKYIEEQDIQNPRELKEHLIQTQPELVRHVYDMVGLSKPRKEMPKGYTKKNRGASRSGYLFHDEMLREFFRERNIKESTMQGYYSTLYFYHQITGFKSVEEMIREAEEEEKQRVPLKETKLKRHLMNYRKWLVGSGRSSNTIKTYFSKLVTIYRHYEINIPVFPLLKLKKEYSVSYYDLPNKEHIQKALDVSQLGMKAFILFQSSSGTAKAEALSITVKMFLESIRGETEKTSLRGIVESLCERRDLVPILYLRRIKTDKYYYTCCSPEATHYILLYILERMNNKYTPLKDENEKLFPWASSYVMQKFQELNDSLGFGFVGKYRFFRSHTLRKFHASNLGTSAEIIDELEGRSKNTVHETYIKTKPDKLRLTYMEHMHNVMINTNDYVGPHLNLMKNGTQESQTVHMLDNGDENEHIQLRGKEQQVVQQATPVRVMQDYNIIKDIAKLELRIEALEKRVKELGG